MEIEQSKFGRAKNVEKEIDHLDARGEPFADSFGDFGQDLEKPQDFLFGFEVGDLLTEGNRLKYERFSDILLDKGDNLGFVLEDLQKGAEILEN